MRLFIKKKIKPFLVKIKIYNLIFNIYTYFHKQKERLYHNIFYKIYGYAPIFLYHRIEKVSSDPVSLCVKPETFENQLNIILNHKKIISLSELSKLILSKSFIGDKCAITFDDGYKDNITNALPILSKYNIPATIFITTNNIGKTADFAWDKRYPIEDRAQFLNESEIFHLANNPLIEIGAHTKNHSRLSDLNTEEQLTEIQSNKEYLEKIIGKSIKLFAYPFGGHLDYNKSTIKILKKMGFEYAYINNNLYSCVKDSPYQISRINIREETDIKCII